MLWHSAMTEWKSDMQLGMLSVKTRSLELAINMRTHIPTPRPHFQTCWKCALLTLKTIVHFNKWGALELGVITGTYNQLEWADIISGDRGDEITRVWRVAMIRGNLSCSGQPTWQRAEGGQDVMSRVLFDEGDTRGHCMCDGGSMSMACPQSR